MIQLGEYTKETMALELGIKGDKASHLTDKLKKLGYSFDTYGRGRTYRIYITRLPQMNIKEFAEKYLGIAARFEDRLAHFLYLLFASGETDQFANMSASSLEWYTYSNNDTIQNWLDSLIDCGLLQEEELIEVYYATKKEKLTAPDANGDYQYTQLWKEITWEDYETAIRAYREEYQKYGDISKNPEVAADEAVYNANMARKDALGGWWAKRKPYNFKVVINKGWTHYSQLLSLLEQYNYQEYSKQKTGNKFKEDAAFLERWEKWEEEKYQKKIKMREEEIEMERLRRERAEEERKAKAAAALEEAKTLDYFEVINSTPKALGENTSVSEFTRAKTEEKDVINAQWQTVVDNFECDEIFDDFKDFLMFINEDYYKQGKWVY